MYSCYCHRATIMIRLGGAAKRLVICGHTADTFSTGYVSFNLENKGVGKVKTKGS